MAISNADLGLRYCETSQSCLSRRPLPLELLRVEPKSMIQRELRQWKQAIVSIALAVIHRRWDFCHVFKNILSKT